MTELTPYQQQTPALLNYQTAAVQRLAEWAHSADAAYKVAERLVQTSFVPAAYRGKPIEATAAILAGTEVGLAPMSALRAFDIISGQAAARAITLRAIVQSYGHDIELVESTNSRCRMRGRRKGSSTWQAVTWTMDRARELGLVSKDNWKKQPGAMLVARATSEICRLIAADAILGIGYSSEEVADGATGEPASPVEPATPQAEQTSRTVSWSPADDDAPAADAPAEPEPEPPGEPEPATAEPADEARITGAQTKMLHACLTDAGITDRDTRLAYVSGVLGHEVASSADLTKAEASAVIDRLRAGGVQ